MAYCELGELENARKMLPTFRAEGTPWMQLAQGIIYETEGKYDAAFVAYDIARRIDASHPDVAAGLGRVFMVRHQYDSAIIQLSNASAADTLNMRAMMDLGDIFEKMGHPVSAIQYYIEVDKKYPWYPKVQLKIAAIRSEQKAHETAIRYLKRGLEYHPDDTAIFFMLGQEYTFTDSYKEAISYFKKALKKGKGKPVEAFRYIGNIYFDKLVDNKKAKEYYKKYVKAGGDESVVKNRLAGI
jgi:tetratricopeptide (TPR) repeat protein